jgi:aminoglycoside 6'-N-acetyltransferase I
MTYRKATRKDLAEISRLMVKLHTDISYEEMLEENIYFFKKCVFFVACDGSKMVGYVFGVIRTDYVEESQQYRDPKVGYVESLFVEPEYRNKGVARELCRLLEAWAKEKGATEMASDAYMENSQSREFHKAIGFAESKPIVHFIKKIGGDNGKENI